MRKPSMLVIFLTVFIDLIGFGIVVPLVPVYSKGIVPECVQGVWAQGLVIGIIGAAFSAMQFIFSPIWGRWSDRYGRRPILLLSTAGAAVSYVLFAVSAVLPNHLTALILIVASRAFAGVFGGNITVANAYIADITPPENRSKRMGLIGMAFGLGFICGPAIGGISLKHIGGVGPGAIAAGLCAANFILAFFILTESRKATSEQAPQRPHLDQWRHTLTQPKVGFLVIVFFLAICCFSCFEWTLPLVVSENFHIDIQRDATSATTITWLFVYCGVVGAFVQGGAIGRLVKMLGEPKLIALSLVLTAISMAMLPFITGTADLSWGILVRPEGRSWLIMLGALALLSVGTGLTRPPLFGMISNLTAAHEQGANLGVAQGAGSLARIVGPIFASTLLVYRQWLPYLICAAVLLGTTALVIQRLCNDGQPVTAKHIGAAAP
jgi:MFS transporter, DHA1 family, tetracycline resistance protein